jgi:hypothetical protein
MVSDWTRSGPRNSEACIGVPVHTDMTVRRDCAVRRPFEDNPACCGWPGAEQVIRCFRVLQAAGAKVSIDDFGTLYFFHERWRDGAFAFTTFRVALIATWVVAAHLSRSGT